MCADGPCSHPGSTVTVRAGFQHPMLLYACSPHILCLHLRGHVLFFQLFFATARNRCIPSDDSCASHGFVWPQPMALKAASAQPRPRIHLRLTGPMYIGAADTRHGTHRPKVPKIISCCLLKTSPPSIQNDNFWQQRENRNDRW